MIPQTQDAVCVFAKPPRPGHVKTRLIPLLGPELAAQLADACLRDSLHGLGKGEWDVHLATTEEGWGRDYPNVSSVLQQGTGGLGDRMRQVLSGALAGANKVIAMGADSPGVPNEWVADAFRRLDECDAVLGPSSDGGFYLLAVKAVHEEMFSGVKFSAEDTCHRTQEQFERLGWAVQRIPEWFDVDLPEDLEPMRRLVAQAPDEFLELGRLFVAFSHP